MRQRPKEVTAEALPALSHPGEAKCTWLRHWLELWNRRPVPGLESYGIGQWRCRNGELRHGRRYSRGLQPLPMAEFYLVRPINNSNFKVPTYSIVVFGGH